MTAFIADIDLVGHETERPFMRIFVLAENPDEATAKATRALDDGEALRGVVALDDVLAPIREGLAAGRCYSISFKHESGTSGPVVVSDLDAAPAAGTPFGIPFGSDPEWMTTLPWMRLSDARRLAHDLGLTLEVS